MKFNSILTKSITSVAFAIAGLAAVNAATSNHAQAAIVANDVATYKVYTATTVYNNYENGYATGQVLAANTSWKVIKTAYDTQGNKWYDLGKNKWVKVVSNSQTSANKTTSNTNNAVKNYNSMQSSSNYKHTYSSTYNYTNTKRSSVSYTSSATGSEASAKAWIASHESGGSYSARNGQYVGKYQLSASYLNGDYSAANQERVADSYVKSRYGSWTAAKSFWQSHGWY